MAMADVDQENMQGCVQICSCVRVWVQRTPASSFVNSTRTRREISSLAVLPQRELYLCDEQ